MLLSPSIKKRLQRGHGSKPIEWCVISNYQWNIEESIVEIIFSLISFWNWKIGNYDSLMGLLNWFLKL